MDQQTSKNTKQEPTASDLANLKGKSVRGGTITVLTQIINVIIRLLSTVALARLLSADDYGIIGMVLVITTFAQLFRDFGLSSAAIQKESLSILEQSNLFWINIVLGSILTIILITVSPVIAWFYQRSEVMWVTIALSFTFIINSFGTQPGVLLTREMRFGWSAIASISGNLINLAVAVILAMHEYRYYSLVWGQIACSITTTFLLFLGSRFRPSLPSRGTELRKMIKFGANVAAYNVVNYFARNLDSILIGRVCGAASLGVYNRAYSLLMMPINTIRGPIQAVAFPAMSRIQSQPIAYCAYYRKVTSLIAHASMPLMAFLFVNSSALIEIALGKQWEAVTPIFSILAVTAFIQASQTLVGMVQLTLGKSDKYLRMGIAYTLCVTLGFFVGVQWGMKGVATAYGIVTYLTLVPFTLWAFHDTPLRFRDFFESIYIPIVGSLIGIGAVLFVKRFSPCIGLLAQLAVDSLVFLSAHLTVLLIFPSGRSDLTWMLSICKRSLKNAALVRGILK